MNRLLFTSAMILLSSCLTGCIEVTPAPPPAPGGIQARNVNTTNANSQIRVWILTEEQIASLETADVAALTYNRVAGTYFVVASNESHYQSLTDTAPFKPGVDFSLLEVEVEEELIPVSVANTSTPTRLPRITRP